MNHRSRLHVCLLLLTSLRVPCGDVVFTLGPRPAPDSAPEPHIGGVRHQEQEAQQPDTACMVMVMVMVMVMLMVMVMVLLYHTVIKTSVGLNPHADGSLVCRVRMEPNLKDGS